MNFRRSSVLCVAAALAVLTAAGCGSSSGGDDPTAGTGPTTVDSEPASTGEPVASDETDSTEPNAPPAEVIPSTLVFFDADGATPSMRGAPVMIADETGLVEFAGDFVDGDPELVRYALAGGAIYFGFLFIAHLISPRGMGFGDVKLAAVMGLFVGWLGTSLTEALVLVLWAMLIGFATGSIYGFGVLLRRRRNRPFPFGPFLAMGTVAAVLLSRGLVSS